MRICRILLGYVLCQESKRRVEKDKIGDAVDSSCVGRQQTGNIEKRKGEQACSQKLNARHGKDICVFNEISDIHDLYGKANSKAKGKQVAGIGHEVSRMQAQEPQANKG